jgi:hypothetical protein
MFRNKESEKEELDGQSTVLEESDEESLIKEQTLG